MRWDTLHDLPRPCGVRDQRRVHLGGDVTRCDTVDFDTSTGPFVGKSFTEAEDTVFGRSVGWNGQAAWPGEVHRMQLA